MFRLPVILLDSYSIGSDADALTLRNVGQADAPGVLVTFGSLDSLSGSGSTSTPSSAFALLGGGDTLFAGTLSADERTSLEQDFIVNSRVTSGIYSLPITVRYQKSDSTVDQQNLRASLIVIALPCIQTDLASSLQMLVYSPDGTSTREVDLAINGVLSGGSNYDYALFLPIQDVIGLNEWVSGQTGDPFRVRLQLNPRASDQP